MYGVIVCSRCHKAHGVRLTTQRTRCTGCGLSIDVTTAKIYYTTDSIEKLVEAVGQVSKRVTPSPEGDLPTHRFDTDRSVRREKGVPAFSEERVRQATIELTEERGGFSAHDLAEMLDIADGERLDRLIADMLNEGIIFEPRRGRYRAVR